MNKHINRRQSNVIKKEKYKKKVEKKAAFAIAKMGMSRKVGMGIGTLGFATLFPNTFGKVFSSITKPFANIFGKLLGGIMPLIILIIVIIIIIAIIKR